MTGMAVVFFAFAGLPAFGQADREADARKTLGEVAEVYRGLTSFEWDALLGVSTDSGEFRAYTFPLTGAFKRPHFMRIDEYGKSPPTNTVSITNGKYAWYWLRYSPTFCRPDPKSWLERAPQAAMSRVEGTLPYEHILERLQSVRAAGNRILRIGGEDVNCMVITAVYAPGRSEWLSAMVLGAPVTYWIDVKNKIVVQQSYSMKGPNIPGRSGAGAVTDTITLTGYRLNPEIPDSRFVFHPAKGSHESSCTALGGGG